MAEYTLYTNPMSRGQIARWALHEARAEYEAEIIDWKAKSSAFLAANPMGKVPTIVHHAVGGDRVVTEAAAICAYLADQHPWAELAPRDSERADYYRWMFFAAGPIEQAVLAKAMGWVVPADREGMAGFGSFERTIAALEGWLERRTWVCGERFTMADVYLGSQVDWGLNFKSLPASDVLTAYAGRLREREAYQAAKAIDNALIAEMQS